MITLRFGADALADVRFAISPLVETMRSIRVLADPSLQALHLPWVVEARERTADLDLAALRALQQPPGAYGPDFVHPPPRSPLSEIEDELAEMVVTPAEQIRAEVGLTYDGRPVPAALQPLIDEPAVAVQDLAQLIRAYWDRALAPHWPRLRALLEGDVLHRARQIADGGARRLFSDLDPAISWSDGVLRIDKKCDDNLDLAGRGLVFVPSVFVWPAVSVVSDPPWQPTIMYPARGVGTLWEPSRACAPESLAALLGRARAAILTALDQPRSTTDLAQALGLSAGGVSQHLGVLRNAGLVHGHRVGRTVLYLRAPAASDLLGASGP